MVFAIATIFSASQADPVSQLDIQRGGLLLNSYGAYLLGTTQPATTSPATIPTRDSGSYAASYNKRFVIGGQEFYLGAVSNGIFDNAGGASVLGKNDLVGFRILEDPENPGIIDVTRRVIANAQGGTGNIASLSLFSVANAGNIGFRYDLGTGDPAGNGYANANLATSIVFGSSFTVPTSGAAGMTVLGTSTANAQKLEVPCIGATNNILFAGTFNKEIVAEGLGLPGPFFYSPKGEVVATITAATEDNRGHVTYNQTSGIAAVYRRNTVAGTGHVRGVAVYRVAIVSGNVVLRDLNNNASATGTFIPFPTAVKTVGSKTYDLEGTNYFSGAPFRGPAQISINDNGDVAVLTVAADPTNTTDGEERGAQDKRYLYMQHTSPSTYAAWKTVAQSGANTSTNMPNGDIINKPGTGNFVTLNQLDDPTNPLNSCAASPPSLDNDGNLFFTAATELDYFANGGSPFTTVKTAVYRARPNGGGGFTVDKILAEGDKFVDPQTLSERTVSFIPLSVATSNLGNPNIRYAADNTLNVNSVIKDSLGGITIACKVGEFDDDTLPTSWQYVYLAYK